MTTSQIKQLYTDFVSWYHEWKRAYPHVMKITSAANFYKIMYYLAVMPEL